MPLQSIALILFILMYVVMIVKQEWRLYAIWAVALLFVGLGILQRNPLYLLSVINWNVIMMIGGTMVIVYYFIESKMPNRLAEIILDKCSNVMWVIILMSLFAVSSNLQGAATLVGDTTSIMLGGYAKMNFMEFFFMKGKPGMFFSVELGAMATVPIMMLLFRKFRQPVEATEKTEVEGYFPSFALIGVVVALIVASFIPNTPGIINGLICCVIAVICMAVDFHVKKMPENLKKSLLSVDRETLMILMGLFLVIQGITDVGLIDLAAEGIVKLGGNNLFLLYSIIVWGSVIFSAFIDNIPYVATMLPIITGICQLLQIEPYLLYFGLLTGATLGGNITPIGASANITAVGMLKQEGYKVGFGEFMKIGIPFTLAAAGTGYLFVWFIWR